MCTLDAIIWSDCPTVTYFTLTGTALLSFWLAVPNVVELNTILETFSVFSTNIN